MGQRIHNIVKYANSKQAKTFKLVIFFVFVALIILDIVFVKFEEFPTISRVIYNSSPDYVVLIWLFGLFVSNVFVQRKVDSNGNFIWNFLILTAITIALFITGLSIESSVELNCDNYQEKIDKVETKYVTRVLCQEYEDGTFHYDNKDCTTMVCNGDIHFKLDLTNEMKLLILVLGVVFGYLFWPSVIETH